MKKNKNNKIIKIVGIAALLLLLLAVLAVSFRGKGYRGKIIASYKEMITDTKIDLNAYDDFTDNPQDWFLENTVIAHGLGQIEEFTTTNSKEAFEQSYANGQKVLEADISLTSDGKAVLSHEFDGFSAEGEVPLYEEFMKGKVEGKFTTLSMEWITQTLMEYEDIYIMTDCKTDSLEQICAQIVTYAKEQGREDVLKRLIVQVYGEEDIKAVRKVYPFENILFSTYKSGYMSQKEAAEFCLKNQIPVVTQGAMKNSAKDTEYFREKNIKVFAFTVNSEELAQELKDAGYHGIYSDNLTRETFEELN